MTSRTVTINGREYPAAFVFIALGCDPALAESAVRSISHEEAAPRPDVGAAVRNGLEAARALEPKPRNRHERRRAAALARKSGLL